MFSFLFLTGCSSLLYVPDDQLYEDPRKLKLPFEEISFQSQGSKLHGWYFQQTKLKSPKAVLIFFHGNGQNRSSHFMALSWLLKSGYEFFIFDYQGYGGSEGSPSPEGTVYDSIAALNIILEKTKDKKTPLVIFGQSLGGAVAMRTLEDYSEITKKDLPEQIKLIILDSTFLSYRRAAASVLSNHWFTFLLQPLSLLVPDSYAPSKKTEKLPKLPVLVFHGDEDQIIDQKLGEEVYMAFQSQKKWIPVKGGRHIETFYTITDEYRDILLKRLEEL